MGEHDEANKHVDFCRKGVGICFGVQVFFFIGNNPLTTYYLNRILGIPDSVSSISRNEKTIKMLGGLANWRLAVDDFTEFPVGRLLLFDKKMGTHSGR
jgi:hypothetical protein